MTQDSKGETFVLNMAYFFIERFVPFFTKLILVFHIVLLLMLLFVGYLSLQ